MIHDVDSGLDCFTGRCGSGVEAVNGADLSDAQAVLAETSKVRRLVRDALLGQQVRLVARLSRRIVAARGSEVEDGQVLAREVRG